MSLYMIMFGFVYMFIFWIYLPHMRENMWPLFFWTWLTSLNIMSSNCIYLPSDHMVSILPSNSIGDIYTHTHIYIYIYHIFLIHSWVVGHLGCFHCLAIVNSIAVIMQVFLLYPDLCSFGHMPRSGITWSYGSSIFSFLSSLLYCFP
jgi:hypothetical protein